MPLRILFEQPPSEIEVRVVSDAGENIEHLLAIRLRIEHAIRRQQRQLVSTGKLHQLFVSPLLTADLMPLNFDEQPVGSEHLPKPFEMANSEQGDKPFTELRQLLPLHRAGL